MTEWIIPLSLSGLAMIAMASRFWLAAATIAILFANWSVCEAVVYLTDDSYPVLFLMVADYGSAIAIFVIRRSHWQSAVMSFYAAQLVCHGAYALSTMGPAPTYYSYWALTYMAWAQAALIGGWIGTSLVGRWRAISSSGRVEARNSAMVADEA